MKREKKWGSLILVAVLWILCLAVFVGRVAEAGAEPPAKGIERTPGPRMIRAVETLASDYLAEREVLRLSAEQEERIRQEVASFKKDLWKKEAVLIGMFEEISIKRRHGLLSREEYRTANQVTGGIEADELGRMIEAVTALQAILTPEQKEAFRVHQKPQLTLQVFSSE